MTKDLFIAVAITSYKAYQGAHSITIALIAGIIIAVAWCGCRKVWQSGSNYKFDNIIQETQSYLNSQIPRMIDYSNLKNLKIE